MIRVSCPKCKMVLQFENQQAGQVVACQSCNTSLRLPQAKPPVAPPSLAPQIQNSAEWYYAKNGQKNGPTTTVQLKELTRSGVVTTSDMVWKEGMAKWTPAGQVAGLFDSPPPKPVIAAPPPLPDESNDAGTSVTSPDELKLPVIGMMVVSGLALFLGIIGVLQADSPVVRILMAVGLAHNIAAVMLSVNIVRLRNFGLASLAPWVVMSCWVWYWFTNPAHGMTLLGMVLAVSAGLWAFFVMRGKDVQRAFESNPPLPPLLFARSKSAHYELDPGTSFPWPVEERTASNLKLLWMRLGIGASVLVGFLFLISIVGSIFCLPFFSLAILIHLFGSSKGRLHARWVPVDGQNGWVEFVSGGIVKREDGTVGNFALLPNQKFIDILDRGRLIDSWRVLAWGVDTLEVQDMAGVVRGFKKGKTLEEKKGNPFHRDRIDNLPGSWLPIDGSNKSLQFTEDGAVVFQGGGAGRYTVSGDEPNEVIRIQMTDGSTRQFRVMSLSKNQLVVSEGAEATTFARRQAQRSGGGSSGDARHNPQDVRTGGEPATQGTDGDSFHSEPAVSSGPANLLSGFWNWLSGKWKCPQCRSRNTVESNRTLVDRQQEVRTDFARAKGDYQPQAVFNIETYESECVCKACGHEWIQVDKTCLRA